MKKLLMTTAILLATAASAQAQIHLNVGYDEQPVRPIYVEEHPYYYYQGNERHRYGYDWAYWDRDRHEDVRGDRREYNEKGHDGRHDNGNHYGNSQRRD